MKKKKTITFNIWFEPHRREERMKFLAKLIRKYKPHVIALQEVKPEILEILEKQSWFKKYKYQSEPLPDGYFAMLFSRIELKITRHKFQKAETRMGRDLVIGVTPDKEWVFATAHFESTKEKEAQDRRAGQLKEAFDLLPTMGKNVVLMGDTNITDEDGKFNLPFPWIDCWKHKKPNEEGWTRDPENPNCPNVGRNRLDRKFFYSFEWSPKSIEIIGNEEDPEFPGLRPSDHYGLYCEYEEKPMNLTKPDGVLPLFERHNEYIYTLMPQIEATVEMVPDILLQIVQLFIVMVELFGKDKSVIQIDDFKKEFYKLMSRDPRNATRFLESVEHLLEIYKTALKDRGYGADDAVEKEWEPIVDIWRLAKGFGKDKNDAILSAWSEFTKGLLYIINEEIWGDYDTTKKAPTKKILASPEMISAIAKGLFGEPFDVSATIAKADAAEAKETPTVEEKKMVNIWDMPDDPNID